MKTRVMSFHYTLTGPDGTVLDSSAGAEPLSFLEGAQQIIPGLEAALLQLAVGDKKKIAVDAPHAYGERMEELVISVPKDKLPKQDLTVGDQFQTMQDGMPIVFSVVKIEAGNVMLDGNHPLAGVDLSFDVEVIEMRDASEEELTHGHAHGAHGHHH